MSVSFVAHSFVAQPDKMNHIKEVNGKSYYLTHDTSEVTYGDKVYLEGKIYTVVRDSDYIHGQNLLRLNFACKNKYTSKVICELNH